MKKLGIVAVLAVTIAHAAFGEGEEAPEPTGEESNFGGWRVTVGPAMNCKIKVRFGCNVNGAISMAPAFKPVSGTTKASASARATGSGDGVFRFDNGGWINPLDEAGRYGETWNYNLPNAAQLINNGILSVRNYYAESSVSSKRINPGNSYGKDDYYAPGVNIQLQRNLYHDDDYSWGVDLSVGLSWFFRPNIMKAGGELYRRTASSTEGYYETDIDVSALQRGGRYPINADGSLGVGSFSGPGPVINVNSATINDVVTKTSNSTGSLGFRARGGYSEFEFTLALRPYYDLADWLRIYGTLGAGVSYLHLRRQTGLYWNRTSVYSSSASCDDWDVFGIAGLGALLHYDRYSLGLDFNTRLWASDVDFNDGIFHGSLSRGVWMFMLYVGVDF